MGLTLASGGNSSEQTVNNQNNRQPTPTGSIFKRAKKELDRRAQGVCIEVQWDRSSWTLGKGREHEIKKKEREWNITERDREKNWR